MFGKKKINIDARVEVFRTRTVDYQATKACVGFNVPPEIMYSEATQLAEFLVEARTTGRYTQEEFDKYRVTYETVFDGDKLSSYLKGLKKVDKERVRRNGFFELTESK